MSDRRRIDVVLRAGRAARIVTLRADEVREHPDRRGRVAFLRDGEAVAKFDGKAVVGWHLREEAG